MAKDDKKIVSRDKQIEMNLTNVKDTDLNELIQSKIDKEVKISVDREIKKVLKHKNTVIIKRDIIILILLVTCFFLGYNLYIGTRINIEIYKSDDKIKKVEKIETKEVEEVKNSLKDKTNKYGYLLDSISLSSDYLKEFYSKKLTDEIKLYISFYNLDDDKVTFDDETSYVDLEDVKNSYSSLFMGEFSPKSFKVKGGVFKYLSSKGLFIYDGEFKKEKADVVREIIDIDEGENISITTIEALKDNDKYYNVISGKEVKVTSDSLSSSKGSLTEVTYMYEKVDDSFKLSNVEVK